MISKQSEIGHFFSFLGQFGYQSWLLEDTRQKWLKAYKKKKNYHCVHLEIPHDKPLIFKKATIPKHENLLPVIGGHQCICTEKNCKTDFHKRSHFLSGSLSIEVYEVIHESGNIIADIKDLTPVLRVHFDRCNEYKESCVCDFMLKRNPTPRIKQPGPLFHTQFGGKSTTDKRLEIPRVPSFPVDFVLLADLVLRNFYSPKETARVLKDNAWKKLVNSSINSLVGPWGSEVPQNEDLFLWM